MIASLRLAPRCLASTLVITTYKYTVSGQPNLKIVYYGILWYTVIHVLWIYMYYGIL